MRPGAPRSTQEHPGAPRSRPGAPRSAQEPPRRSPQDAQKEPLTDSGLKVARNTVKRGLWSNFWAGQQNLENPAPGAPRSAQERPGAQKYQKCATGVIYVGFALLGPILHAIYAGPWIYGAGAGFSRFCCPAQKLLQRLV